MIVAVALIGFGAFAADDMKRDKSAPKGGAIKMMDADNDGMISKQEFVKYHEARYDGMKKNARGMVDVKDMEMMLQRGYP
jgi:Ca2+-binding EF-hand superfamily protein